MSHLCGDASSVHQEPAPTEPHPSNYYQRVAEMRRVVSSGSVSPQATAQWLQLLKEINDLHNAGELSTAMFRQRNTKLLSVIEGPPAE